MINRKRLALLSAAGMGTAVMIGLAYAMPHTPADVRSAATDLMAMMQARSPGDRSGAVTNKPVKIALATSNMLGDSEAASGDISPHSASTQGGTSSSSIAAPAPLVASTFASSGATSGPAMAPAVLSAGPGASAAIPAAAVAGGLPAGAAFSALPLIPALFGGGGGGGGGSPSAASAVPEPATWLMMIVGFGIMGSALRRRRRVDAKREYGAAITNQQLSSVGIS